MRPVKGSPKGPKNLWLNLDSIDDLRTALEQGKTPDDVCLRSEVADQIQKFVEGAYLLGFNPLPHLRECFPRFHWDFMEIPAKASKPQRTRLRERMVATVDLFWDALGPQSDHDHYVTAHIPHRSKALSIYGTCSFHELATRYHELDYVEELQMHKANDVSEPDGQHPTTGEM